jgi:3-oxoacyl-[acyl-carrier protein] reductase
MDLNLKNKRVLITAASRGLGFATAQQLVREGAWVAINARNGDALITAAEQLRKDATGEILSLPGDVTTPEFPSQAVAQVIAAWGGLDILITNAGGPPSGAFENQDDAAWQKAIDLCLMSHVRLIRAALPYLRQSTCPSVLTITSISVKQPIANLVLSNSIRAATAGLTKSLALELGSENIRFNSILPASTLTERIRDLLSYRAAQNGTTIEEEMRKQAAESPFKRLGTPEEFANAAVFLVSPAASYITGLMLTVDGGSYKATF